MLRLDAEHAGNLRRLGMRVPDTERHGEFVVTHAWLRNRPRGNDRVAIGRRPGRSVHTNQ
jgi:hypothetical protein